VCDVHSVDTDVVERALASTEGMVGVGDFLSALASDTRVIILYALGESEMCVCDVGAVTGATKATVSYHLRLLYRVGLVDYRKDGRRVYYRLADPGLRPLLESVVAYGRGHSRAVTRALGDE
jgi:DNA-binding transcriptional ArsR family regulator